MLPSAQIDRSHRPQPSAVASRPGRVGEMPLALQPKLLRVLQEREFYRLGDTRPVSIDVRVIASTNCSLQVLVREGRFRRELYFRLAVIPLSLPPLRERGEDVIELAQSFAAKFGAPAAPPRINDSFRAALRTHHWPGNVRELANTMRRAVALSDGDEIGSHFLPVPAAAAGAAPGQALGRALVHPLLSEDGELRVVTLDPGIEEELTRAFSGQAPVGNQSLEPSFVRRLLESLKKLAGEQVRMATPVLFCSTPARFHLRRLLEPFLRQVVVLSPGEIPPVVQVQSLGTIR